MQTQKSRHLVNKINAEAVLLSQQIGHSLQQLHLVRAQHQWAPQADIGTALTLIEKALTTGAAALLVLNQTKAAP
jgi:hypothetical protein